MTANATHPGRVTIPGTNIGVRGTLVAEPQTENMLLELDDRLTLGPVKVDTDSTGTVQGGLVVPIVTGILWLLRFEPHNNDVPSFSLGVYNLNTSGVDLKDLVAVVPIAIDPTVALQISQAAALGATNDTATASFVNNNASSSTGALNGRLVGLRADRYLAADGTTDDSTALASLVTTANTLGLPIVIPKGKTVALASTYVIPAGTKIRAELGGGFKATAAVTTLLQTNAANVALDGVTIDTNGNATHALWVATGSDGLTVRRCNFLGTSAATTAITVPGVGVSNVTIDDNDFSGYANAIRVFSGGWITHSKIVGNRIKNWYSRGIILAGTNTGACDDVLIAHNSVTDLASGLTGSSRYPIRTESTVTTGMKHTNIRVIGNHVKGPGVLSNDTTNVGTADQISVTYANGAVIANNVSVDGGDGGITITSCDGVTCSGNYVGNVAGTGIYVGANGATSPGTHRVTVVGNTVLGAGRDITVDVSDTAIRMYSADTVTVSGNTLGNLVGSTLTAHGIAYKNSDNVTIGVNTNAQCTGSFLWDDGGNTNISLPAVASGNVVCSQTGGDLTLPQSDSTNFTDVPGCSVTLAVGTYVISGYVEYEAPTTTVDCKIRFTTGGGLTFTGSWSPNAHRQASTAISDTINRSATAFSGGTGVIMGTQAATPMSAAPIGRINVTVGGTIKLAASQGAAEAVDVKVRNCGLVFSKVA